MTSGELQSRAAALGVEVTYEDVDQVVHTAADDVLRAVIAVLDDDRDRRRRSVAAVHTDLSAPIVVEGPVGDVTFTVEGASAPVELRRAGGAGRAGGTIELPRDLPAGCHTLSIEVGSAIEECVVVVAPRQMPGLSADRRWSSLFVPAYALWERGAPLPSYAHLGDVCARVGELGIDMLATLPLYATFLDEPFDPSPYSPISRLHWNEAYLDDASLPIAPPAGDDAGDDSGTAAGAPSDMVDWRRLGRHRREQLLAAAARPDAATTERLGHFVDEHPDVAAYARFRAGLESGGDAAPEVVERSHALAQMLCDEQLGRIAGSGGAGLSLDLPIGSHPQGYETWAHPNLFAPAMAVGAPPDTFFTEGQNWGFPPQLPGEMRRTGYALWRRMIERAGRHADMLRIDHVMAVHRLWWVPDGYPADRGVYVRYPHDELLAVIAASAAAADVAVVGENLGTVPPEVGIALDHVGMLGMFEEQFTTGGAHLAAIPERSVAGIRTHDMAAFAEHVATTDLRRYRGNLAASLAAPVTDLFDAVLTRLAISDARMVVADLDDLLDETRPHNLPGRIVPGIWQRRLDAPISDVFADDRVLRRLEILARKQQRT